MNQRDCTVISRIISDNRSNRKIHTNTTKANASRQHVTIQSSWILSCILTKNTIKNTTITDVTKKDSGNVSNLIPKYKSSTTGTKLKIINENTGYIQCFNKYNAPISNSKKKKFTIFNFKSSKIKTVSIFNDDNGKINIKAIKTQNRSNNLNLDKMNNE